MCIPDAFIQTHNGKKRKTYMKSIYRTLAFIGIAFLPLAACVDIEGPTLDPVEPSDALARVKISTTGIVMQLGDSIDLSLAAFAMDKSEISISNPFSVEWISGDRTRIRVDSTGRVWGISLSKDPVRLIARWTHHGVTQADTIPVTVTEDRFDITSIKLVAMDSLRVGGISLSGTPRIRVDGYVGETRTVEGAMLPLRTTAAVQITRMGEADHYTIENPDAHIGDFTIHVGGNIYGREMTDSIVLTGLYPATEVNGGFIDIVSFETNPDILIFEPPPPNFVQPCAVVLMGVYTSDRPIDIVFSDSAVGSSTDCDKSDPNNEILQAEFISGNIENFPPNTYAIVGRKSATLGEVTWYVRYADTKEVIPFRGRFFSRLPE